MKTKIYINYRVLSTIFVLIYLTAFLNALTIDEFKNEYKIVIDDAQPLFLDDVFTLTADDGAYVTIKKMNPFYDSNIRRQYTEKEMEAIREAIKDNDYMPQKEYFYFVCCEDGDHILYIFDDERDYLRKYEDTLRLEKYGDFNNISVYYFKYMLYNHNYKWELDTETGEDRFSYIAGEDKVIMWLDKKHETYCGSFDYPYTDLERDYDELYWGDDFDLTFLAQKKEEAALYYDYIKDFYIVYINTEIERCNDLLNKDIDFSIELSVHSAVYDMWRWNEELADEFFDKLAELLENENKTATNQRINAGRLEEVYGRTVSEFQRMFRVFSEMKEYAGTSPGISGELPLTQDELQAFEQWVSNVYTKAFGWNGMEDYMGTPVKLELVPEGIKITSAGIDKIFGTDDDQYFIRTYKSAGMEPLD